MIMFITDQASEYKFVRFSRWTTARSVRLDMDYHLILPGRLSFVCTVKYKSKLHKKAQLYN